MSESDTKEWFGFQEEDDGLDIEAIFKESSDSLTDPLPVFDEPEQDQTDEAPQVGTESVAETEFLEEGKAAEPLTETRIENKNDRAEIGGRRSHTPYAFAILGTGGPEAKAARNAEPDHPPC